MAPQSRLLTQQIRIKSLSDPLAFSRTWRYTLLSSKRTPGGVAQLVRALPCQGRGRRFKSGHPRIEKKKKTASRLSSAGSLFLCPQCLDTDDRPRLVILHFVDQHRDAPADEESPDDYEA